MKITQNSVVELIYELEVEGQIVDRTVEERPLDYIHGTHSLIKGFEKATEGLEPGDKFDFVVDPEDGYGEIDPERIIELPIAAFVDNEGKRLEQFLREGAMVPLVNNMGQTIPGKVTKVGEETVTLDLNSPMAGKTLHFTGKILSVREATEQELHDGLHGENIRTNGCGGCHGKGGCHHGEGGCHHNEGEGCSHGEGGCNGGGCGHCGE